MIVILLSAKQGAGKSSTAEALRIKLERLGQPITIMKFADPLYEMHGRVRQVLQEFGADNMPPEKVDGPLLQLLGTEWGRKTRDKDIWVKVARGRVKATAGAMYLFDDARMANEMDAFDDTNFFPLKVRLECPEFLRKERAHKWRENTQHESEIALDHYDKWDLVLDSSALNQEARAEMILQQIMSRSPKYGYGTIPTNY